MFCKFIKNDSFLTAEIFTYDKYQELITNVYNILKSLDYVGRVKNAQLFQQMFTEGVLNYWFYDVASWLCYRLGTMLRVQNDISVNSLKLLKIAFMEESLHMDPRHFLNEMSALLNVLECPIKQLTSGLIRERLNLAQNQLLIIDFLIVELNAKTEAANNSEVRNEIEIVELEESRTARELQGLLVTLKVSRPPSDLKAGMVFSKINKRLCSLSKPLLPENILKEALFSGSLNSRLYYSLERLYGEFYTEFRNRREMDMNRLSAIICSYMWNQPIEIQGALQNRREISGDENAASGGSVEQATADHDASDVITAAAGTASCGAVFQIPGVAFYDVQFSHAPYQRGRAYQAPPGFPIWQQPRGDHIGGMPFTVPRAGAHACPARVVAPFAVGDNFPQFGKAPIVMSPNDLRGADIIVNQGVHVAPVSGGSFQYQHGWGVPQGPFVPFGGHIPFGGHGPVFGQALNNLDYSPFGGHANADYGLFNGHAFDNANQAPFGGHAYNADQGLYGDRGQYNNPVHNEGPLTDQGRDDHIQDPGQQVRRVQFGGDHSYLEGFGGFQSHY